MAVASHVQPMSSRLNANVNLLSLIHYHGLLWATHKHAGWNVANVLASGHHLYSISTHNIISIYQYQSITYHSCRYTLHRHCSKDSKYFYNSLELKFSTDINAHKTYMRLQITEVSLPLIHYKCHQFKFFLQLSVILTQFDFRYTS